MSAPQETCAALRFWGDDLDPDEVSAVLGRQPTKSEKKGDVLVGTVTGQKRTAKTGGWLLRSTEYTDQSLDKQIEGILRMLTHDLSAWEVLTNRFGADVFCGIFLRTTNDGLSLQTSTIQLLAERGLKLELDIYGKLDD